jgi:hypothetical protein
MSFNLATILTEATLAAPDAPVHLFAEPRRRTASSMSNRAASRRAYARPASVPARWWRCSCRTSRSS